MAPGDAGDPDPDKGGGVDGQWARRHLGNGDDVGKGLLGNPAVPLHHLFLDGGDHRIAPADAEQPDLQKRQEKLP